jgi:hypothetical protein
MEPPTLEISGFLLLLGSWLVISSLVVFCVRRILRNGDGPSEPESQQLG